MLEKTFYILLLSSFAFCHETGKPHEHTKPLPKIKPGGLLKPLPKTNICLKRECIAASHRLFEYMDDTVNPCDDFYQFACGGFQQKQVIPDANDR